MAKPAQYLGVICACNESIMSGGAREPWRLKTLSWRNGHSAGQTSLTTDTEQDQRALDVNENKETFTQVVFLHSDTAGQSAKEWDMTFKVGLLLAWHNL